MQESFKQCCETVYKMNHDHKIMHRNISSYHILIDANHNPKLSGFGLSKDEMDDNDFAHDIVGAIDYRPPEVEKGHYKKSVDFYSLCITFYEALTGF